ncbi:hypothetical protein K474DRAFT_1521738 [Panus rudis PR-1116 ss-1]|nr:hypothetical protein K474DRAFT_1521738 [Panus rudis PR-1116 ss-1]
MSSLVLVGFFALGNGRRASSIAASGKTTWHMFYPTTIQCRSGAMIPAELRVYSPVNDTVLPVNSVVFLVARAHIPRGQTCSAQLDSIVMHVVPGDVCEEEYENNVPDMPFPLAFALGSIPALFTIRPDSSRMFPLEAGDRVREERKSTVIHCILPSIPRWSSITPPQINTACSVVGVCAERDGDNRLGIIVESMVFNVGPPVISIGGGQLPVAASTPSKRRKFNSSVQTGNAPAPGDDVGGPSSIIACGVPSHAAPPVLNSAASAMLGTEALTPIDVGSQP